jgi:hypothetical protein
LGDCKGLCDAALVDMDRASAIDRASMTRLRRPRMNQDHQLGNIAIRWLMTEAPIDLLPIVLSFLLLKVLLQVDFDSNDAGTAGMFFVRIFFNL